MNKTITRRELLVVLHPLREEANLLIIFLHRAARQLQISQVPGSSQTLHHFAGILENLAEATRTQEPRLDAILDDLAAAHTPE